MSLQEEAQAALSDLQIAIRQRKTAKAVRAAARLVDNNLWQHFQEDDGTAFENFGQLVSSVLLEIAEE